jgi:hypothetical protein
MAAEARAAEVCPRTPTSVSPLPKVWIGFPLALLVFFFELLEVIFEMERNAFLWRIVLVLVVFAYWLFCIQRIHTVLAELSCNQYPVTPNKAAAFHLIPIFNLYWIFKWPNELANYINGKGRVQMIGGLGLGFLLLGSFFLLKRVDSAFGLVCLFSIAMYINQKLSVHVGERASFISNTGGESFPGGA